MSHRQISEEAPTLARCTPRAQEKASARSAKYSKAKAVRVHDPTQTVIEVDFNSVASVVFLEWVAAALGVRFTHYLDMDTNLTAPSTESAATVESTHSEPDAGKVVDLIVKATVVLAAVLYGFGFLVISIHQPGGNPGFKHNDGCLLDDAVLEKKVADVWEDCDETRKENERLEAALERQQRPVSQREVIMASGNCQPQSFMQVASVCFNIIRARSSEEPRTTEKD